MRLEIDRRRHLELRRQPHRLRRAPINCRTASAPTALALNLALARNLALAGLAGLALAAFARIALAPILILILLLLLLLLLALCLLFAFLLFLFLLAKRPMRRCEAGMNDTPGQYLDTVCASSCAPCAHEALHPVML